MEPEFNGIEKRLNELSERLKRLETLRGKTRSEFDEDPYLRDIAERNLELAIQCCLDISQRVISMENARRPTDNHEAMIILGEMGILPIDFAKRFAPMAGFRNILVHEYLQVDWDEVYKNLQQIDDLTRFGEVVRGWLRQH